MLYHSDIMCYITEWVGCIGRLMALFRPGWVMAVRLHRSCPVPIREYRNICCTIASRTSQPLNYELH